jgi:hypothetical protein
LLRPAPGEAGASSGGIVGKRRCIAAQNRDSSPSFLFASTFTTPQVRLAHDGRLRSVIIGPVKSVGKKRRAK